MMSKNKVINVKSKTYKNLMLAFAGESQARNKYTYFSSVAKKEGYVELAKFFISIANNEKEHAKVWFKCLNKIGSTENNLKQAILGENEEWTKMYKQMAIEAKKEGYLEIAKLFENVAKIEKDHEQSFNFWLKNIRNKKVFNSDKVIKWRCSNCGRIIVAKTAPKICDTCSHPQSYFKKV